MSGRRAGNLPGTLQETGDDILDLYQLRPHFSGPCVEHHRYFSDPSRGIRNQLEVQRWTRFRELGSGAFGTVFLEREENNGSLRAVKVLSKAKYKTKAVNYLREILAMANLSREDAYFIQLYGWFSDDTNIYIAMEFAPHGDLHDCVQQPLPEVEAREITRQIAEALEIMHSKKFAHRDLKPSNIFVVQRGPLWWVKLGDFGVAKRVANDFTRYRTSIDTDFTAPDISFPDVEEEEEADEYTSKVDMWSLGCLLHWLLTLELPLNKKQMYALCLGKVSLPIDRLRPFDPLVVDFITRLLQVQAKRRADAGTILMHEWLSNDRISSMSASHLPSDQPDIQSIVDPIPLPYRGASAFHSSYQPSRSSPGTALSSRAGTIGTTSLLGNPQADQTWEDRFYSLLGRRRNPAAEGSLHSLSCADPGVIRSKPGLAGLVSECRKAAVGDYGVRSNRTLNEDANETLSTLGPKSARVQPKDLLPKHLKEWRVGMPPQLSSLADTHDPTQQTREARKGREKNAFWSPGDIPSSEPETSKPVNDVQLTTTSGTAGASPANPPVRYTMTPKKSAAIIIKNIAGEVVDFPRPLRRNDQNDTHHEDHRNDPHFPRTTFDANGRKVFRYYGTSVPL
ncbi:hypothetical protein LTR99_006941 [Exophiala xenobiotica]|uniref:non-specific serine/threonine protein kinase n=1 Tax=Vermiconidia calcicola TaxID=1690605 RepID=A0AAV9PYC6_9PEZI|nr:hypothetical protein LTR96_005203 [Exophiala xenobiotica]KAK5531937.1 hypothetical protein LTR25_008267 [Vermiconidia calcicola]KAK5537235.1 hypothetical protein LTR23_007446 [Chaetothyriales sp. CCFEE 6169]KAK5300194.1 hypothetical protein LTR99_006941 [Exophiala xenobiotica]KAK5339425.1 hypothetical protein LTR98_004226 [Exophiala xenobiotica]